MKKHFLWVGVFSLFLWGCGEDGGLLSKKEGGSLNLIVKSAPSDFQKGSRGEISRYRVVVSGEGFSPIQKEVSRENREVVISGIPEGKKRKVEVTAINPWAQTIRVGENEDVEVFSGTTAEAEVVLDPVPVFVNLNNGNSVDNNRFVVRIFSDSPDPVQVEGDLLENPLIDFNLGVQEFFPDEKGMIKIYPDILEPQQYQLVAKNIINARSSAVDIRLLNGSNYKGASFASGGWVKQGGVFVPTRLGQPFSRISNDHSNLGEVFPNIAVP